MADNPDGELEQFRRQWQEEVSAKNRTSGHNPKKSKSKATSSAARPTKGPPATQGVAKDVNDRNDDDVVERGYHDLENRDRASVLGESGSAKHPNVQTEPSSALEHYEFAVEKESEGALGDSLDHYRKAYKVS